MCMMEMMMMMMMMMCFFLRFFGDLFVTCCDGTELPAVSKTMSGRHSDWGHSSEGEWCGDYDPRGQLKSW